MKADKIRHKKNTLLQALEQSLGVVTRACEIAGIHRSTFYEYLNNDEEFAKAVKSIDDIALDFAESQLHKQIKEGNSTSTIFYLKTKGKRRGYVEKQEIDHTTQGEKIQTNIINLGAGTKPDEATE